MLLQESPLGFEFGNVERFSKKEHVCVEGGAKEGELVLVLVAVARTDMPIGRKGVVRIAQDGKEFVKPEI
jgi:hypothetical protein